MFCPRTQKLFFHMFVVFVRIFESILDLVCPLMLFKWTDVTLTAVISIYSTP